MTVTRRQLVVSTALAVGGLSLLRSSSAVADSADQAAVATAVEALRQAMFSQDKASWTRCAPSS